LHFFPLTCYAKRVKKLLYSFSIILTIIIALFLSSSQPVYAIAAPPAPVVPTIVPGKIDGKGSPNCKCNSENDTTPGYNGFLCLDPGRNVYRPMTGNAAYCPTQYKCVNTVKGDFPNTPDCVPNNANSANISDNNCWCSNPGNGANGKNGRTCTDGSQIYPDMSGKFCKSTQVCVDGTQNVDYFNSTNTDVVNQAKDKKVAVCEPMKCTCDHPNTPGSGQNGMTCRYAGKIANSNNANNVPKQIFCQETEVCSQNGDTAQCVPLKCNCVNPGQAGKGKNQYNCTINGGSITNYCPIETQACQGPGADQPAGEIKCEDVPQASAGSPTPLPTIPPPPSPPCIKFGEGGKCLSVATALSIGAGENDTTGTSTDPQSFIQQLFQIILGIAGGIALLLIMFAGYRLMVSQGKPEAIQQAREQLIAAIVGLLFFIFSLVILQVIGVDLLHLPGFGG
jgi:hypothetical protein